MTKPLDPSERDPRWIRDGRQKHPLYVTWCSMIRRCTKPTDRQWKNYGGRGIGVCQRWRESFWAFVEDVGPRPSSLHSLDRFPDNDGDYGPGNVRWATDSEQNLNRRDNRSMTVGGRTQTLEEWAKETGLPKSTLFNRIRRGWSDEQVVLRPVQAKRDDNSLFPVGGRERCRELGLNPYTVASRMRRGWTFEQAIETPVGTQKGGRGNARP